MIMGVGVSALSLVAFGLNWRVPALASFACIGLILQHGLLGPGRAGRIVGLILFAIVFGYIVFSGARRLREAEQDARD